MIQNEKAKKLKSSLVTTCNKSEPHSQINTLLISWLPGGKLQDVKMAESQIVPLS